MATRSRTNLFIQYRQSFGKSVLSRNAATKYSEPDTDRLLEAHNKTDEHVTIEMSTLPPQWYLPLYCNF